MAGLGFMGVGIWEHEMIKGESSCGMLVMALKEKY
jgi:hypothetical protein